MSKELQLQSGKEPRGRLGRLGVYSKDTCWDFHILLLATLLSYSRALVLLEAVNQVIGQDLNGQKRKEKKLPVELRGLDLENLQGKRVHYAEQVRQCAIVLWQIAYSRALSVYLEQRSTMLQMPDQDHEALRTYEIYMGTAGGVSGGGNEAGDEGNEVGEQGIGEEDEDIMQIVQEEANTPSDYLQPVRDTFLKWIHWQATQLAGLDSISADAKSRPVPLKILFIAVKHPSIRNKPQVEAWGEMVAKVLTLQPPMDSNNRLEVKDVVEAITKLTTKKPCTKWPNTIFYAFSGDPAEFWGTEHCKALLSLLALKAGSNISLSLAVKALLQVNLLAWSCYPPI